MTQEQIRVGIIGANPHVGWAGRAHFPAILNLPEFHIAALCTSKPESAQAAAAHYGVPRYFHDFHEMVQLPDIDLVSVSVKVPHHFEMVQAALAAGKHVFCEWPLGKDVAEADTMNATAKTKNVRTMVGLQAQCDPVLLRLKELLSEGYVGHVLSCTMTLFTGGTIHLDSENAWEADKSNGAHALSIGGGHTLDALAFCVADFQEISCQVTTELKTRTAADTGEAVPVTSPDHIVIIGKLANGATVSATVTYVPWFGSGWRMEVYGSEGTLTATSESYPQIVRPRLFGARKDESALQELPIPERLTWVPPEVPQGPGFNVAQMFRRLGEGIRAGQHVEPNFDRAVKIHRLLETIEASSRTGQRLKVE